MGQGIFKIVSQKWDKTGKHLKMFVKVSEAAQKFFLPRHTIANWVKAGKVEIRKEEGIILVEPNDIYFNKNIKKILLQKATPECSFCGFEYAIPYYIETLDKPIYLCINHWWKARYKNFMSLAEK